MGDSGNNSPEPRTSTKLLSVSPGMRLKKSFNQSKKNSSRRESHHSKKTKVYFKDSDDDSKIDDPLVKSKVGNFMSID